MQVSVESTSALERRMTIGVPAERIETEVTKRLQQTARRAKVAVPKTLVKIKRRHASISAKVSCARRTA